MIVSDTCDHSISRKMNAHPLAVDLEIHGFVNVFQTEKQTDKHNLALDELINQRLTTGEP